jgi:integrase
MPRPNRGPYLKFNRDRGVFYIFWSEVGVTRKRSTGTADSDAAQAALAAFIRDRQLRSQPSGPRDPGQYSVAEALELYGELHAPTTSAPDRIGYAIDALLGFWATSTVEDVTKETCKAYARYRSRADGTVRRELGALRTALNFAHSEGRLTRVPFVWLPEKPSGKDRWLRRDEAARLLNAARRNKSKVRLYLPLFIVLALYTGARKEAILSLRWPQVDLENGLIDFNPPGRRQTNKRRAKIPIPDRLRIFLELAKRRGSDLGYVVQVHGLRIKNIKRAFAKACEIAEIEGVTPHTLRHTCGTWMAQRGVPLFQIGGWLGQSHERTVELYAHHHPSFLEEAKRAADRR